MDRIILVVLLLPACASAPSTFSARSPASLEASAAPRIVVARAILEEPPAPGTASEGWSGLSAPTGDAHAHHHHTMTMPDGTTMEMDGPMTSGGDDAH